MAEQKRLNKGFCISRKDICDRIEFNVKFPKGYSLVPLKEIAQRTEILTFDNEEIIAYLRHMPLVESHKIKPFYDAEFEFFPIGPDGLYSPQTFILNSKLGPMLGGFTRLYKKASFSGLARRRAHYVLGVDAEGNKRAALYTPPLIERNKHDLLFDGNHRMSIAGPFGVEMEVIGIRGSLVKPPYTGVPWDPKFVDEKPPIEERYRNFKPELLKDFAYVGIDG